MNPKSPQQQTAELRADGDERLASALETVMDTTRQQFAFISSMSIVDQQLSVVINPETTIPAARHQQNAFVLVGTVRGRTEMDLPHIRPPRPRPERADHGISDPVESLLHVPHQVDGNIPSAGPGVDETPGQSFGGPDRL